MDLDLDLNLKFAFNLFKEAIFSSVNLWLLFRWDGFDAEKYETTDEKQKHPIHFNVEHKFARSLVWNAYNSIFFSSWFT